MENSSVIHTTRAKGDYSLRYRQHDYAVAPRDYTKPVWFTSQFKDACNIRYVTLYVRTSDAKELDITRFVTEWPFWLEGFKALSRVVVEIHETRSQAHRAGRVRGTMLRIQKKLGVTGILDTQSMSRWGAEDWVFEATGNELMDWSQELGQVWRPEKEHPQWNILDGEGGYLVQADGGFWLKNWVSRPFWEGVLRR